MSTLSIQIPDTLHRQAQRLAEREHTSLDQLIALALTEKLSAWMTEEILETRARRGSRERFLHALDQVPERPPLAGDEWPPADGP